MERAVSNQLDEHCKNNNICSHFQSAYKRHHSTETALLRVQNDILKAVDRLGGAILVLLDLSAAFDTIDHNIMLNTLQSVIGITNKAWAWFRSYLTDRYQSVKIGASISTSRPLPFGVPQGSVLGPQLFSIYTQPLQDTIIKCGMSFHLYADDTQLYLAFNPNSEPTEVKSIISTTTDAIYSWMRSHFLKLNSDKTEVLVITQPSLKIPLLTSVNIGDCTIAVSPVIKDLGVQFDTHMKMYDHIQSTCKKAYLQIHLIGKIRKYITEATTKNLVQVNVISLLDYCNCLLTGLPSYLISKLQRVQNSAARLIKQTGRFNHITPVLRDLHWLPIEFRIDYKIILITFKVLKNIAPPYLKELVRPYVPNRPLRSMNENKLSPGTFRCKAYGGRAFSVRSPQLWNSLPTRLRRTESLKDFKRSLKTHLFRKAFRSVL